MRTIYAGHVDTASFESMMGCDTFDICMGYGLNEFTLLDPFNRRFIQRQITFYADMADNVVISRFFKNYIYLEFLFLFGYSSSQVSPYILYNLVKVVR